MKLTENRLIVVDKHGEVHPFLNETGRMHQECLNIFANKMGYSYSNINHIVEQENNTVFSNADNNMFVVNMPKQLKEAQLETLDRLALKMSGIDYMEVRKQGNGSNQDFVLEENIDDQFSRVVLQSYFEPTERIR